MNSHRFRTTSLGLIAGLGLMLLGAVSQAFADDDDPPSRVARLGLIQGAVSFQTAGDSTWVPADPNRPLTSGDNLWNGEQSRAELRIENTSFRLASMTGVSFLDLNDNLVRMQLAQGSIN